jgi:hypothetical protein
MNVFGLLGLKTEKILDDRKMISLDYERLWLQARSLILRCVASVQYAVDGRYAPKCDTNDLNNATNGTSERNVDEILDNLLCELRELTHKIKTNPEHVWVVTILGPQSPRLLTYRKRHHLEIITSLLELTVTLRTHSKENLSLGDNKAAELLEQTVRDVQSIVGKSTSLSDAKQLIEELASLVDTLSLSCVILGIVKSSIQRNFLKSKKGKKKKEIPDAASGDLTASYNNIVSRFEKCAIDMLTAAQHITFTSNFDYSDLKIESTHLWELEGYKKTLNKVKDNLTRSHLQSIKGLNEVIDCKLKYLSTLRI